MRTISEFSTTELQSLKEKYEDRGLTGGGIFALADINRELFRRAPTFHSGMIVTQTILALLRASGRNYITYKELWTTLNPGAEWKGNHSVRIIGNELRVCIVHCIDNGLPIVTTVVRQSSGKIEYKAIQNIYDECMRLGLDVGLVPDEFVENQHARVLAISQAPAS